MIKKCLWALTFGMLPLTAAERFTVATFNVENYFLTPFGTRKAKPEVSRAKVAEVILQIRPDVLALQEMGRPVALKELRERLARKGLKYSYSAWVQGPDPAIHLVVLSRFPIVKDHSKGRVDYLLNQRRLQVSRGFAAVEIQVTDQYRFTLYNAHLKSKRPVPHEDQAAMRLEEARQLRSLVAARLKVNPEENLLVLGDLNDTPNTDPIRELIGRRGARLIDLRPVEQDGDVAPNPYNSRYAPRRVAWTHFYHVKDEYSRLDYTLASRGLARELDREGCRVETVRDWGLASDHRAVVVRFFAEDR